MAAYASLVSVMQIINQLQHHPSPPISIDEQQVESLTEIVTFLQQFLEGSTAESDPLEIRIADAAYEAEDVIESYIVDAIQLRRRRSTSSSHHEEIRPWNEFYHDLQKVIEEMDSIKKTVMEMMREKSSAVEAHQQQQRNIIRSSSVIGKNMSSMTVGFDDVLVQLLDKLTGGSSSRQVIPITGMGGIGKTTLARNVFEHALIKDHFDICAWVTISQQYNTKEIICKILPRESGNLSEEKLGVELHKYLYDRRYLIIMDDIWSVEVWEKMGSFLVDCNNGSRIIVTTRQSHLTSQLTQSNYGLDMKFLDEVNSWNLFSKIVFGEESTIPLELEIIGKKIVGKCRGLPLSIVVIGGLLAKSQHTQKYWEDIEQKFNSIVNFENDQYCLKILKLSYNHLPAHLKPCFLYMGSFEEDKRIRVSSLIKLWVSEGFLKPENGKTLETIGKEFLKDLIDRNLILIHNLGSTGNIKYCKIHDLLRDLCLKEAENERFYYVIGQHGAQGIHNRRRMFYPKISSNEVFQSLSHIRSLTSQHHQVRLSTNFRLLRIFNASYSDIFIVEPDLPEYRLKKVIDELVNSRYVAINAYSWKTKLPSSFNFLWNLHTLRIEAGKGVIVAPVEIWKMSQLRHVEFLLNGMHLPNPPIDSDTVILENLQTLKGVVNFKCGEEVVKRIPNIMKLKIEYQEFTEIGRHDGDYYCLSNLQRLCKLESLTFNRLSRSDDEFMQSLTFPQSLKKLVMIDHCSFGWEEMLEKIGSLPPSSETRFEIRELHNTQVGNN
ncbi:hypothetical protein C2S51_009877 [Perilla frutescens var. frutescens]|nr:hypothetical protein C2S51_009877 [Perilla frutescens var. frutescens]